MKDFITVFNQSAEYLALLKNNDEQRFTAIRLLGSLGECVSRGELRKEVAIKHMEALVAAMMLYTQKIPS